MLRYLFSLLVVSLLLTGCQSTLEIGFEGGTPAAADTPVAGATATEPATVPTATVTATSAATIIPTQSPTQTFTPLPTPTQTPTSSPTSNPTSTATSTPRPPDPQIISFGVSPAVAEPGDTVVLTWLTTGASATICPTARFILFDEDDCWQVPLEGDVAYTIPPQAQGFQHIVFVLKVRNAVSDGYAREQVTVALACDVTWFYSDEPQAGICPREPLHTYAAAQRFERGTMIWLEEPGRYYILEGAPLFEGAERRRFEIINDPLEIVRDTSSEVQAPPGLHAPVSGFGLVWRGDVAGSPGYRERLGWALEPEFGYEALLQCDDALPSGGRSWQTCYLQGPDGVIFGLHPLGGWYLLAAEATSLIVDDVPIIAADVHWPGNLEYNDLLGEEVLARIEGLRDRAADRLLTGNNWQAPAYMGNVLARVTYTGFPTLTYQIELGNSVVYTGTAYAYGAYMPLRHFSAWDGHWVLEVDDHLILDGRDLGQALGYDAVFGFALLGDQPFYFFEQEGVVRLSFAGLVLPQAYDLVIHNRCCEAAIHNVEAGPDAVWFHALRNGTWYFVEARLDEG